MNDKNQPENTKGRRDRGGGGGILGVESPHRNSPGAAGSLVLQVKTELGSLDEYHWCFPEVWNSWRWF